MNRLPLLSAFLLSAVGAGCGFIEGVEDGANDYLEDRPFDPVSGMLGDSSTNPIDGPSSDPGSTAGYRFTCDGSGSLGICVEYSSSSAGEIDRLKSECGYTVTDAHTCPSSNNVCRHTTDTGHTDTYDYRGQSSAEHDADCRQYEGTPL